MLATINVSYTINVKLKVYAPNTSARQVSTSTQMLMLEKINMLKYNVLLQMLKSLLLFAPPKMAMTD